jgi:hypothetical protein
MDTSFILSFRDPQQTAAQLTQNPLMNGWQGGRDRRARRQQNGRPGGPSLPALLREKAG